MDYINAFWVGGLIVHLSRFLWRKTKMLPGRIMVFDRMFRCGVRSSRNL